MKSAHGNIQLVHGRYQWSDDRRSSHYRRVLHVDRRGGEGDRKVGRGMRVHIPDVADVKLQDNDTAFGLGILGTPQSTVVDRRARLDSFRSVVAVSTDDIAKHCSDIIDEDLHQSDSYEEWKQFK